MEEMWRRKIWEIIKELKVFAFVVAG